MLMLISYDKLCGCTKIHRKCESSKYHMAPIFCGKKYINLYRYCITALMYHDMAIYQYIVSSLVLMQHLLPME